MKILGLNANKKGVGTYHRAFYFMKEFAKRGHDVTMFTVSKNSKWLAHSSVIEGVRVVEGPNFFYKFFGNGWNIIDLIIRLEKLVTERFDLVYAAEYQPVVSWPIYLTRKIRKYKLISDWCDWHSGASNRFRGYKWAHKLDALCEEHIRHLADVVVVNNSFLKQRACLMGIPKDKILLIRDGDDTEYMRPLPKEKQREKFHLPRRENIIATIYGGEDERVAKVFAGVLKTLPNTRLLLIGKKNSTAVSLLKKMGIYNKVIETGYVADADLPGYISSADVCFQILNNNLCDRSRYPLKVSNYLSAGRPVVVNDIGDIAQIFQKNKVGLLTPPEFNNNEFSEKIIVLLKNRELKKECGENARDVMVKEHDWKKTIGNKMEILFKKLYET